jgi:diaminopimelate decarboxylase
MARVCLGVGREEGHPMTTLDVGGGFPSGELTDEVVAMLKPAQDDPLGYRVIAEPGRHFSSSACHLLTRVIGRRVKAGRVCYHINDSVYHSFNARLMDGLSLDDAQDQVQDCSKPMAPSHIFGMTCDGMDVVGENVLLPSLAVGDWLCISEMGAYTIGPKSTFNGMHCGDRIEDLPVQQPLRTHLSH